VLRSIGCGTKRVHQRLNVGLAITECCTPNATTKRKSMNSDWVSAPRRGPSIVGMRPNPKFPTKAAIHA